MPMLIYVAHTGGCLQADPNDFTSVEELRKWIEENISMPAGCQILMTARGTNIKPSALSNERELFLFDRRLLDASSTPPTEALPRLQTPSPFPDNLDSETELSSWRTLFKKRLLWSESVLSHAQMLATQITDADNAAATIQRSVHVAFANLERHSGGLQDSLGKLREWAEGVLVEQDKVLRDWEPSVKRLTRIPVHEELRKYGGGEVGEEEKKDVKVLADFFDVKKVQISAAASASLAEKFERDVVDLGGTIEDICARTAELKGDIQKSRSARSANIAETLKMLIGEIDVLVKKVRTDYDYVLTLQGPKSISIASKRAYASTTDYLPGLVNTVTDVGRLLQQAVQQKNSISATCSRHLQTVALVQSISAPVNPQISALDTAFQEEDDHFRLLTLVIRFPTMYGSLLVECVRRREWSEKFATDSKRVAEELALAKEDEEKRRKKWQRNTGSFLPFNLDSDTSAIIRAELNTRGDPSGGLPKITRVDVEVFLASIKNIEGMEQVTKDVSALFARLDETVAQGRRHTKRPKGFKFSSIHEASTGTSSIFAPRDEVEVKALRADKEALTQRVQGYESRIRKLEDLIHRARGTSGNVYTAVGSPTPQPPGTPQPGQSFPGQSFPGLMGIESPSSPISIRRISADTGGDRPMPARVVALEAELALERELTAKLQKEASMRAGTEKEMHERMSQADDTKRDLVANLEALDQQHIVERKEFHREIEELKQKLDEAYEEMDRMEELRVEEGERKTFVEERMRSLEGELEILGGEVERLRDLSEEKERTVADLEKQLEEARGRANAERQRFQEELEEQRKKTAEESRKVAEKEAALRTSEAENRRLVESISALESQMKSMNDVLDTAKLQNESQAESRESLATMMKTAHRRLSDETPPEDLSTLMDSIEALITKSISRNKSLSAKLLEEKERADAAEEEKTRLQGRFESRTMKAKDLTQRLYTHHIRSIQLLESLGYRIVRSEDSMQIVKVSRSNNADSVILSRSTHDVSKSGHLPPTQSSTAEDISLLYWMSDLDSEAETEAYSRYISNISTFDLDAFTDTVVSRVKKVESDCRQLMKQCRAYREKYYRSRDEANEKIAFKSFKSGDLALFLPTRNSVTRPWAAFNVGAPHFFLKEEAGHKLGSRDWLLARITKIEDRVVDLSRSAASIQLPPLSGAADRASIHSSDGASIDDENPFELSDGLRWYLLDAVEEKPGAPSTPGLSSSTVAAANVDAKGSLRSRKPVTGAKKTLSQITTEHSRRSSSASGRGNLQSRDGVPGEVVAAVRDAIEGRSDDVAAVAVEGEKESPAEGQS